MRQNRLVTGVLIAFDILIIFTLGISCAQQQRDSVSEAEVASVLESYVEALVYEEYQKAYSYLADLENKPTFEQFSHAFISRYNVPSEENVSVEIRSISINGDEATAELLMTDWPEAPFSNPYRTEDLALLVKQDNQWRLFSMLTEYYWDEDWYQESDWP